MPADHLPEVVDEAIKLTVWSNIRRYLMLGGIGFVVADLAITLTVVVLLAASVREADREHARVACRNTATLARIQHTTVKQQQAQTAALVKQGFTFGIPKAQFDRLIVQSRRQEAQFLAALDRLKRSNCKTLK